MGTGRTRTVMFACLHGSAKSLIAAEHFRRLGVQRGLDVTATSVGIDPDPEVPSKVVKGLREDGIDVRSYRPRRVTREDLADAWCMVSFGCDLAGLAPASLPVERWDDVPAVSEDFRVARDTIVARLQRLLARWEDARNSPAM